MAQYVAFDANVEVMGQTIISVVNALPTGQETRLAILKRHKITPQEGVWYKQQAWLDAFKEMATEIGDRTLFAIGKAIPEHAAFPPQIDNLQKALSAIDVAYQMNHRNGAIGKYTLTHFDEKKREATMVCNNPYPSEFDRGIISAMLRRFRPKDSFKYDVVTDVSAKSRLKGDDSCTYRVTW
jgi:hypothetical protein